MPLVSRLGAASSRGFGEFAQQTAANYIEDVFSTYLYTGNGSTQTITNGIDLAGKGGMVWLKARDYPQDHGIFDTSRGEDPYLSTNLSDAQYNASNGIIYNNNGFTNKTTSYFGGSGFGNNKPYTSWTFRKAPKFFDVVTYTGDGVAGRTISHNLGSVPGMIIVKSTSASGAWWVYHRSLTSYDYNLRLNTTDASSNTYNAWGADPTSTTFNVDGTGTTNENGTSYVAYLFAHDAGGFGADGSQNVISCGGYTGTGNVNNQINLGWEPQFILVKCVGEAGWNWYILDTMRGIFTSGDDIALNPNVSDAESTITPGGTPAGYARLEVNANGFRVNDPSGGIFNRVTNYIYMAIRRGPMRTPTDATKVYAPVAYTATNVDGRLISSGFPVDSAIIDPRNGYSTPGGPNWFSRLTGNGYFLQTASTNTESNGSSNSNGIMGQDGITVSRTGTNVWSNVGTNTYISWFLARAPGFFDVVCGPYATTPLQHSLGVVPELFFIRQRGIANQWYTWTTGLGSSEYITLNGTGGRTNYGSTLWLTPTSTQAGFINFGSSDPAIMYLFASCPGVSKVGNYTGTGLTQTINCGFTGGARFVLIKRLDTTGDWYTFDTARGMVSGTDPYLLMNSTAAETNGDWVYTTTGGFQIVTGTSGINAIGGTYLYLAIA